MNISGPTTWPYGTPQKKVNELDSVLLTDTFCYLGSL